MLAKVCIRISRKKDFIKPFGNRIYIRKEIPPMVNNNVDWRKVLVKIAGNISTELNLNILVEEGVELMLTKEDMDMVHDAIRLSLIARKDELKLSDEKLGKQAFGYMAAPRGKIQSLFVGQGAPGKRKPQTINICELVNLCEAMGLSWQDEIRKALRQLKQ